MCLTTKRLVPAFTVDQLLKLSVQTSPKDITCYKKFKQERGVLLSPHKNFKWPSTTVIVRVKEFGAFVSSSGTRLDIHEGLHAYTDIGYAKSYSYVRRKMVIPANTPYIISGSGSEIVALAMRLAKPEKENARPKRKSPVRGKRKLAKKR